MATRRDEIDSAARAAGLLPQILVKEPHRPLPRKRGRFLVIARRRVVIETVLCAAVFEHLEFDPGRL